MSLPTFMLIKFLANVLLTHTCSMFANVFYFEFLQMDRQLHAVYGECLLKDGCWNCVVDKFKGARLFFLSESSTHVELIAMAQEDYNLDKNTESVGVSLLITRSNDAMDGSKHRSYSYYK